MTLFSRRHNLTHRFEEALGYAFRLHHSQRRKGSGVPYISHLLAVAALVLEDHGDEDQAIAALLHDAVEDQGGLKTLEEIRRRFGDRVAEIVLANSDSFTQPKPDWRTRKKQYLVHLRDAPPEVLRVSLADKIHNARTIVTDLQRSGEPVWERFKGGQEGTMWYYRSLVAVFQESSASAEMVSELRRLVAEMERISP